MLNASGSLFGAAVRSNSDEGDAAHLVLEPESVLDPAPGQFLHVRPADPEGTDPLLRRPFSVSDWEPAANRMHLIVRPVGRMSSRLARMVPGDVLDCLGPLGQGFPMPPGDRGVCVLVAGGVGAAPLILLARRLTAAGFTPAVFLGAGTRKNLIGAGLFEAAGASVRITTDDGSAGEKGQVTAAVARHLEGAVPVTAVYGCGPRPMLAEVARMFPQTPAFGSFEEFMACGVGACRGCCIPLRDPDGQARYARVCRDGPVFSLKEVQFE